MKRWKKTFLRIKWRIKNIISEQRETIYMAKAKFLDENHIVYALLFKPNIYL